MAKMAISCNTFLTPMNQFNRGFIRRDLDLGVKNGDTFCRFQPNPNLRVSI